VWTADDSCVPLVVGTASSRRVVPEGDWLLRSAKYAPAMPGSQVSSKLSGRSVANTTGEHKMNRPC
jgi:hypothetical protein